VGVRGRFDGCADLAVREMQRARFVAGGELVVFTTTVRGAVDVALARTEDLIECTS